MKKVLLKNFLWLSLVILLAAGCAKSVKPLLDNREFQKENLPYRQLKILAIMDGSREKKEVELVVAESSELLRRQVGITLKIVAWKKIEKTNTPMVERMQRVINLCRPENSQFDIAVVFSGLTLAESVFHNFFGFGYSGVIDDTWRRHIILNELNSHALIHEIGHAFIFTIDHKIASQTQKAKEEQREASDYSGINFSH